LLRRIQVEGQQEEMIDGLKTTAKYTATKNRKEDGTMASETPGKRPPQIIGSQGLLIEYDVPAMIRGRISNCEKQIIHPALTELDTQFGQQDWCLNVIPKYTQDKKAILLIGIKLGRIPSCGLTEAAITIERKFDKYWRSFCA
jgi:hypothetical protein